jgi:pimeloyl-ACP methyl ester carboxylesterase
MGARWYDPEIGRFTQPDSIIPNFFIPQTMNRYAYARNNPLKYIDPSGHDVIIISGIGTDYDYIEPKSWEKWISGYAGEVAYKEWHEAWVGNPIVDENGFVHGEVSDAQKMAIAKDKGIAVFDWSSVGSVIRSTTDAAQALQKFIDDSGMQDVTIVAHSKGAMAATELLAMYQNGTADKGSVKNMVLLDPITTPKLGATSQKIDAKKTGVQVIFGSGPVSCLFNDSCSNIQNADSTFTMSDHDPRPVSPGPIYDKLGICGDAHAVCAQ